MSDGEAALSALREAMRLAPDSIDLALHYGRTLMDMLRYDDSEQHFKDMMSRHPRSPEIQTLLADAYYRQDKNIAKTRTRMLWQSWKR